MTECAFCGELVSPERVELGYSWCMSPRCSSLGIKKSNRIVLVCGHKSGYQPMFRDQVKVDAASPRR